MRAKITSCHRVPLSPKTLGICSSAKIINRSDMAQWIDHSAKCAHSIWGSLIKHGGSWASGGCLCRCCKMPFHFLFLYWEKPEEVFLKHKENKIKLQPKGCFLEQRERQWVSNKIMCTTDSLQINQKSEFWNPVWQHMFLKMSPLIR